MFFNLFFIFYFGGIVVNLNDYRKNTYFNYGIKECPHYSEDGVIEKFFEVVGQDQKPFVVEFGETRSLGTTTRAFRIGNVSRAVYFAGSIDLYSCLLYTSPSPRDS